MVIDNDSEERRGDFDPRRLEDRNLCDTNLATLIDHPSRHFPNSSLLTFWDDIDDGIREPSGTNHHQSQTDAWTAVCGTEIEPLLLFSPSQPTHFLYEEDTVDTPFSDKPYAQFTSEQTLDSCALSRVERSTCGQAKNKIWHLLRHGRLTSSRLGEIFNQLESTNSDKFVCEIMGYNEVGGDRTAKSLAMEWGRENEPRARKL